MASANPNIDAIIATTRRFYASNSLAQQIYDGRPFLRWLQKSNVTKTWDGGDPIIEPLLTEGNSTVQSMTAFAEMDFTPQDGMSGASYTSKLYSATVVLDLVTQLKNSGGAKIIDIWDAKMNQMRESFADRMNGDAFKDGTTHTTDLTGLAAMVSATGTYGGISRSTNTFWQAYVESTAGALNEDDIRTGYNTVGRNLPDYSPELMLTTQTLHQKYESMILPAYRTQSLSNGDLGVSTLSWRGVPVMWDGQCQTGVWYFLNSKVMSLRPHSNAKIGRAHV